MEVDLRRAKKRRTAADGTVWHHFPCPVCASRGHGPDPSSHLGVGIGPQGVRIKCLRCDATRLPGRLRIVSDGLEWKQGSKTGRPVKSPPRPSWASCEGLPGTRVGEMSLGAQQVHDEMLQRLYPALRPIDWRVSKIRAMPGWFVLPYWTPEGWGYLKRAVDPARTPKVLACGPSGPACLRPVEPDASRHWVVVEGFADALAVPHPYEPMILLGSDFRTVGNLPGVYTLATDNDPAGEAKRRKLRRALRRAGRVVRDLEYPGDDPAESGLGRMSEALRGEST